MESTISESSQAFVLNSKEAVTNSTANALKSLSTTLECIFCLVLSTLRKPLSYVDIDV